MIVAVSTAGYSPCDGRARTHHVRALPVAIVIRVQVPVYLRKHHGLCAITIVVPAIVELRRTGIRAGIQIVAVIPNSETTAVQVSVAIVVFVVTRTTGGVRAGCSRCPCRRKFGLAAGFTPRALSSQSVPVRV